MAERLARGVTFFTRSIPTMKSVKEWLKQRLEGKRAKAAERAHQEQRYGVPRRGSGAPRSDSIGKAGPHGGQ